MKQLLKKLAEKELDNYIYTAIAVCLICAVGGIDAMNDTAKAMSTGLFGALLIKIKG